MDNLEMWNKYKDPPEWAKKPIAGGRLKGMTDINPVWRLQVLTEQYGPCGEGWDYTIDKMWNEPANHGCVLAFVLVTLKVKNGDKWSNGIPGIGGSQMVQIESAGLHANDECYKMALTDALGVACKALGIGSEVYKGAKGKYDKQPIQPDGTPPTQKKGDDNPWLSEKTPEFAQAKAAIAQGLRSLKDVRTKYKISKKVAELLEPSKKDLPPPPDPYDNQNDLPF